MYMYIYRWMGEELMSIKSKLVDVVKWYKAN